MNTTSTTARITAFFAAVTVTAVLLGSQFGLASSYNAEVGVVLAGQPAAAAVVLAATPAQTTRR